MSKAITLAQLRALAVASQSFTADVAAAAADAIEAIDDELDSEVAAVEESSTASAAHSAGSYLRFNGNLYKVTQAIAVGGTITPGTNVESTSVGEELKTISDGVTGLTYSAVTETITIPTSLGSYADETIIFVT